MFVFEIGWIGYTPRLPDSLSGERRERGDREDEGGERGERGDEGGGEVGEVRWERKREGRR